MKNVIFIAPPAAGKGTQSGRLKEVGYEHISTGDMLREEIAKESPIGLEVKEIMEKGLLVSDDIVFTLIKQKLSGLNKPFILDGFPRNIKQAEMLDDLFKELNIADYAVIYLDVSMETALHRALGRRTCACGATYNVYNPLLQPKKDGICDKCEKELTVRTDDNEETFKTRFNTFVTNNEPIKEYYKKHNKLFIVNANNENIIDEIKEILM